MSTHPDPGTLAAVAVGDQPTPELQEHLAGCAACAAEIDALRRLSGDLSGLEPVAWAEPPAALWARIEGGLDPGELSGGQPTDQRSAGPTRRGWLGLAAAASFGVVAGVVGTRVWENAVRQPPPQEVLATAALETLDDRRELGTASLVRAGGAIELTVRTQPLDPGAGYLEVWLLNTDGRRMVSLGVLADNTTGLFAIAPSLLQAGYRVVDISRESFDDRPAHSGDSLARGLLVL